MQVFYRANPPQSDDRIVPLRRWIVLTLAGTLAAVGLGCGTTDPPPPPPTPPPQLTTVEVNPANAALNSLGETRTLTATGLDQNGNTMSVTFTWRTVDADVAVVSSAGVVTAVGNGSTPVTATSSGISNSATVVVDQQAAQLEILSHPSGAFEGIAFDISPVVELQDANSHRVTGDNSTQITAAIESNPSGASIVGTATETAAQGVAVFSDLAVSAWGTGFTLSFSGDALPEVVTQSFDVLAIPAVVNVDPSDLAFAAFGARASLSATALDGDGVEINGITFQWTSTNPVIADVDDLGTVEAVGNGTAQVTASAGGVTSDPVAVDVRQVATSMTMTPELSIVAAGATATITVEAFDSRDNAIAAPELATTVTDGNVLTITGTTLTGVTAGQTDFSMTSGTASAAGRVAVVDSDGFAAIITSDRTDATVVAQAGTDLVVRLMLLRPTAGTGSLGSAQGRLEWDESLLELTGNELTADGFTWFPNDSESAQGVFRFSAFSAGGNQTAGSDVVIAELTFSVTGAAGAESEFDLVIDVVGTAGGDTVTEKVQVVDTDLWIVL